MTIWKAQYVADMVGVMRHIDVDARLVRQVLKKDLGMRFRQIRRVPPEGNTARCLVL